MRCPQCHKSETKVIESRDVAGGESIRRRRECISCAHRYTTYERIERPNLVIIKKDGTRQVFDRDKLRAGVQRATQKTSVSGLQLEDLIAQVEKQLYEMSENEAPSNKVGELVMEELAKLDDVAYVRFASVYRNFRDIDSFQRELNNLKKKANEKKK